MAKRTVCCVMILIALASLSAGCVGAPASLTPIATPTGTVTMTPSPTPTQNALPTSTTWLNSPTPKPALEATAVLVTTKQDEEDDITNHPEPKGIWLPDTEYGVYGDSHQDKYDKVIKRRITEKEATQTPVYDYCKKISIISGVWTYFFDMHTPIETKFVDEDNYPGSDVEFRVCRKKADGTIEKLGIYGNDLKIAGDYLFFCNMEYVKGDSDLWDVYRANLDGSGQVYVGSSIELFIPVSGQYMYFSLANYKDTVIYRADLSFSRVEKMNIIIPNWSSIEEQVEPNESYMTITKVTDEWIYFELNVGGMPTDQSSEWASYIGRYRIKLFGGAVHQLK